MPKQPLKKATQEAADTPLGVRTTSLRETLKSLGIKIHETKYALGRIILAYPKGASDQDIKSLVERAIKTATDNGYTVEQSGKNGIRLNESEFTDSQSGKSKSKSKSGNTKKSVPVQQIGSVSQPKKPEDASLESESEIRRKPVRISSVRLAEKSKGGMKNHVTLSGEAFIGLLEGIAPMRLAEALGVYIQKMSPKSRKAFVSSILENSGIHFKNESKEPKVSKEDLDLLAQVKKLAMKASKKK